ncbi:kinase-like domain-containing protein [Gloeopeniophorella convolvens]|nr:kinase-like domain-containing protein [Gloeopeniophorella convolvens]
MEFASGQLSLKPSRVVPAYLSVIICASCPQVIACIVIFALQALVFFIIPMSLLMACSHQHMQPSPAAPSPVPALVDLRSVGSIPDSISSTPSTYPPSHAIPSLPLVSPNRIERPLGPAGPILRDGDCKYYVHGLLGAGGFGRVALATAASKSVTKSVALKVYSKRHLLANPALRKSCDMESQIMIENTRKDSIMLAQSRGIFEDEYNLYLVMEYYPNTLGHAIYGRTPLPTTLLRQWAEELVLAMSELYSRRIVHCDLKPSNILVTPDGHLAIADFGGAVMPHPREDAGKKLEEFTFYGSGGTYAYQAPEILIAHSGGSFTCAADMWSLGVVLYEMFAGKRLFSADPLCVKNQVWGWDIPAIVRQDIDDEGMRDVITQLLRVEDKDRLTLNGLTQHQYFAHLRNNWTFVAERLNRPLMHLPKAPLGSLYWEDALMFDKPEMPFSYKCPSGVFNREHPFGRL